MALELNENNFQKEVIEEEGLILVDFWAPWCGPCKMLSPVIDEIDKEYEGKVKVAKLNTDENTALSAKYQITSIPCLIFFKEGKPVDKVIGFKQKPHLKEIIDGLL
ncbi:MAG: thioredoxin [Elusimicrobiota bacterium]|jgi:thioredoxin 1|nr:thioredoxin [Elusimicrobiota bacterium]